MPNHRDKDTPNEPIQDGEEADYSVEGGGPILTGRMFDFDPEWEIDPEEAEAQALEELSTVEQRPREQAVATLLSAQTRLQRLDREHSDRYDANNPDVELGQHVNLSRAPLLGLRVAVEVALAVERGNYREAVLNVGRSLQGCIAGVREWVARAGLGELVPSHLGDDVNLPVGVPLDREVVFTWATEETLRVRERIARVHELMPSAGLWKFVGANLMKGNVHLELVRLEWLERGLAALAPGQDARQYELLLRDLISAASQEPVRAPQGAGARATN